MRILVTGAAGFIGMHVAAALARRGHEVFGVDNFNDYYDPKLKFAREANISRECRIRRLDIADDVALKEHVLEVNPNVVVHLAAQAGVRYSLENPMAYVRSNLVGHVAILEACRSLGDRLSHLVYASSSSVYGGNKKIPFSEEDSAELPISLYAATKRADELLSSAQSHLYGLKQIGLRFFTVYGPWGRPDMAYWIFAERILQGKPIRVFNNGDMRRDFTWIDDVVAGIIATVENPVEFGLDARPHKVYNVGNNQSVPLMQMIKILELALDREANVQFAPMQPGDVKETFADISSFSEDYGYAPKTPLSVGIPQFVNWYQKFRSQQVFLRR